MKKILTALILTFSIVSYSQQFTPSQAWGNSFNRFRIILGDTVSTKLNGCLAVINGNLYVANGTIWNLAGGSSLPSQAGNARKFLTTDATNLSWGLPNFSDSVDFTGSGVGMVLRINPGGSGTKKYDFANVGGINIITGIAPVVVSGSGSFRDVAVDTTDRISGLYTKGRWSKDSAALSISGSVDSLIYSTRAWRQKGDDSLGVLINGRATFGDARDITRDSLEGLERLKAKTSAGVKIQSNSGATVAEWGLGGGTNFDFHGFAGYDANRASSYTARSFTDKNYVDSSGLLKVNKAGDVITGRLTTQSLLLNKDSIPITTSNVMVLTLDTATNRVQRIFIPTKLSDTTLTGAYTLQFRDLGRVFYVNSATNVNITIPTGIQPAIFNKDSDINFYQEGVGQIVFVAGAGMTINSMFSANKTFTTEAAATIHFKSSSVVKLSGALTL